MAKLTYVGPYSAVEIQPPDGKIEIVEHGKSTKDLPQQYADSLALSGDWKKTKSATSEKE